MQLTADDGLS